MKESERLFSASKEWIHPWKKWGPYVSERQWATVREDYSANGDAWNYTTHDMARSFAYRWGEDGLAGICDYYQVLAFSLGLWNEKDPILKERLYGLNSTEGNHGEDVKELYYYLDATPTHSYMKFLYKYPQVEFPYQKLIDENRKRSLKDREYELLDTGIFNENRYFDVYVEYAKKGPEEIAIRLEIFNRAESQASIHVLPQLFYRNRWKWETDPAKVRPIIRKGNQPSSLFADSTRSPSVSHVSFDYKLDSYQLIGESGGAALFTNNETHMQKIYGKPDETPYVKDAFHRHIIHKENCINPNEEGTKAALHYKFTIAPHSSKVIRFWLTKASSLNYDVSEVDRIVSLRKKEADEFYASISPSLTEDEKNIQRQALAGMLWSKQFYHYNLKKWLEGDPTMPLPPKERLHLRNSDWRYLRAKTIISMPDKWEYPWFAAWDLCFHSIALSLVDIMFAKEQLMLLLTYHYQNPRGQIPAYEWEFSDLNPPVQAWAALRIYQMDPKRDLVFLEEVFLKLIVNFNWWVNKVDQFGNNLFEGGFLGLDNISIIDRSRSLLNGEVIEQSDGTGWMGFFTLLMMRISLELSKTGKGHFQELAIMFFEYFTYIARSFHSNLGKEIGMWNEEDGFVYDVVRFQNGSQIDLKVRSLVGIIPFYAFDFLDEADMESIPKFKQKFALFMNEYPNLSKNAVEVIETNGKKRYVFSLLSESQRKKALEKIFDPDEFFSPFGIRSLSKYHETNPVDFEGYQVGYEPGESLEKIKGGNSNWRGPVWMPMNFLLVDSLQRIEATGKTCQIKIKNEEKDLSEWIRMLRDRIIRLYRFENGRPVHGDAKIYAENPLWKDLVLFYEHYHGETGRGLGASHQTGWSGLIAMLLFEKR